MTAEVEIYKPRAPSSPTCISKITETNNPPSTLISTDGPMHTPPIGPADKKPSLYCTESAENESSFKLLAIQALHSLERICAAFSSDSLGSLEMTDEGTDYGDDSQSGSVDQLSTNERNSKVVPPERLSNLSHSRKAMLDLECSSDSSSFKEDVNLVVDESLQASGPSRPLTPIVKCFTSTPRQHTSSTSSASSSSSSGSISFLSSVHSEKPSQSKGSPTLARTPILASSKPSPTYPTSKFAKSVKDTFYKAVPPLQNVSPPPIRSNPNIKSQQPLLPLQDKVSQARFLKTPDQTLASPRSSPRSSPTSLPIKPRSHTINAVSPLPPNLSTPILETFSTTSYFKPRSNTVNTFSPVSPSRHSSSSERRMPLIKPRSHTIDASLPVSRPHTAKTISSSAKRRSNTLDSYLQVPSKNAKSPSRTKAVTPEADVTQTVPTAAFMRRSDVKTTPKNTRRTSSSVSLIPNWCPALPSSVLSPIQYRDILRNGANMGVR